MDNLIYYIKCVKNYLLKFIVIVSLVSSYYKIFIRFHYYYIKHVKCVYV